MTSSKVLIAFGSRYGSSEEISQEIAKILDEEGINTQVFDLRTSKKKEWPSLEEFDGVVIGSGIKVGKWTKEAKQFLDNNKDMFEGKRKILGLFVSSGEASKPENHEKAKEKYLVKVMDEVGIRAEIFDAFGGVFDLTKSSRMGFLAKKIVKALNKDLEDNTRNDLRDWDQIRGFAKEFAQLV